MSIRTRRSKIPKSILDEMKNFAEEEEKFKAHLKKVIITKIDNPILVFMSRYKPERLFLKFKGPKDEVRRSYLIINELQKLLKDEKIEDKERHINYILDIIKYKNVRPHLIKLISNRKKLVNLMKKNKFEPPKMDLMMQKKGKFMNKSVLRKCYMTKNAFGQLKKDKKDELLKPLFFRDQYVILESKNTVLEKVANIKKLNKQKLGIKKILNWPSKKELKNYTCRLRFENLHDLKQTAIYFPSPKDCKVLKYHVVTERILSNDPNLGKKIKVLPSIWKVKQFEFFYNNILKKFFKSPEIYNKISTSTKKIEEVTKNFVEEKFPNLEESLLEKDDKVIDFQNNVHVTVLKLRDVVDVEDGLGDKLMASVIVRDYENLEPRKKILRFKSEFEVVKQKRVFRDVVLDQVQFVEVKKNVPRKFLERVFFKHKLLFMVKKIVFENLKREEEFGKIEGDLRVFENMNLEIQIIPFEGAVPLCSPTVKNEENLEFLCFQTESSLILSFKKIDDLKILVVDKNTEKVIVELLPDLRNRLGIIILEQFINIPFLGKINESVIKGNMFVSVVIFPKNLEMAHLSLSKTEIEWNFENFGDLLENTRDYLDFKMDFFPENYLEDQNLAGFNNNFHFYNQKHIGFTNFPAFFNENKYIFSKLQNENFENFNLLEELKKIKKLEEKDINFIFETTLTNYNREEKKHKNKIFDILTKITNLLDTKNRAILHSINFSTFSSDFTKLIFNQIKSKFQNQLMFEIDQKIISFVEKHSYLTNHQKFRFFKLTFEIILLFNNNFIKNANLKISFSKNYFIIILKTMLGNYDLSDEYLRKIVINCVFRINWMQSYSEFSSLVGICNKILVFKHFFKSLFFDFYDGFFGKRLDFDDILSRFLSNSFCEVLSVEDFNVYIDFKVFFENVLSFENFKTGVIEKFAEIEMTIFGLFDVLLLLQIFKDNYLKVKTLEGNNILKFVQEIIRTDCLNIKLLLPKMMKLFITLYNEDFYLEEIKYLISLQKTQIFEKGEKTQKLKTKISSLNLTSETLQKLITKKITKNQNFIFKTKNIYQNTENSKPQIPLQKSIYDTNILDFQTQKNTENILHRDIFFEVLDTYTESTYENPKEFEKTQNSQKSQNLNILLIHLNNLDYSMIDSINIKRKKEDFISQVEIDREEFNELVKIFEIEISFNAISEIWDLFGFLYGSESEVSLFFVIVGFLVFSGKEFFEGFEDCVFFLREVTRVFFGEGEKVLAEAVSCFFRVLKEFYPTISLDEAVCNSFDNIEGENFFYIKEAKIYFYDFEVDVVYLCKKHFSSFLFKTGKYGIHFSTSFCKDLIVVFKDLEKTKNFIKKDQKFTLLLSTSQLQKEKTYSIEFKISFPNNEPHIFSKNLSPLYFPNQISQKSLISPNIIKYFLYISPLNYHMKNDYPETPFIFRKYPLIFNLEYKKKVFLQTKITFDFDKEIEMVNSLTSWSYSKEDKIQDLLLELEEKKLNLAIPFSFFFMKLVYLVKYILNLVVTKLGEDSILKFVKLNTDDYDLVTGSKKRIDFESFLYDLKEFEDFMKQNKSFTLVIQYKF